jgi:anti-sigma factor RsiW
MTCRESSNLLPLFLDGELDSHQMRAVALHGSRCPTCESELRALERLQELVSDTINARADEIDLSNFWPAVERELGSARISWWTRARLWWGETDHGWLIRMPAYAALAAVAILALLLFTRTPPSSVEPDAARIAAVDNAASIDSLETDVDSVAVLNDPDTHTTVLWVSDDSISGDTP